MIHYHCGYLTPYSKQLDLAGRHLLVSHARPQAVAIAHQLGQTVLLDNGAFTVWRSGGSADWPGYYSWCERWFECPTTWAVIPDVIDGGADLQDELLEQWPHGYRGAPVWHMDEPIYRLLRLVDGWPRVCIGSAGAYATVGSDDWHRRMSEVMDEVSRRRFPPWLHGLRMQAVGHLYPFGSVDSADIARNHNRPQNAVLSMAARWDRVQPPIGWKRLAVEKLED